MRIGITIPTLNVAGGVKCLLELGWHLRERGHEVGYYWQAYSFKNFLKNRIMPPRVLWTPHEHLVTPIRNWTDLPEADVMIASSWRTAGPVAQWQREGKGRGLYWVQHHEALWDGGAPAAATYRLPLSKVAISTWLQEILERDYGQRSTLCVTPVDDDLFEARDFSENRARRVLMLHHTFDWKGVQDGLDAFALARESIPDIELVVLGGRVETPALPDGVEYHFQPDRRELSRLYASCGIFLCPSWHEGLGMPAMEAMATGAMLVTTDTGGSRDFAHHGVTALVSPPRDPKALGSNLELGLRQWDSFEGLRLAGREQVREFRWEENCARLEGLIQSDF